MNYTSKKLNKCRMENSVRKVRWGKADMATGESALAASLADSIGRFIIMLDVAIWKPWCDGT